MLQPYYKFFPYFATGKVPTQTNFEQLIDALSRTANPDVIFTTASFAARFKSTIVTKTLVSTIGFSPNTQIDLCVYLGTEFTNAIQSIKAIGIYAMIGGESAPVYGFAKFMQYDNTRLSASVNMATDVTGNIYGIARFLFETNTSWNELKCCTASEYVIEAIEIYNGTGFTA